MEINIDEIRAWRYVGWNNEVEVLTKDGWRLYSHEPFAEEDVQFLIAHNVPQELSQVKNKPNILKRTAQCEPVTEFDQGCWECWAGAERWPNGDQPLICKIGCWSLRADPKGVETDCDELTQFGESFTFQLHRKFQTQQEARTFLEQLPADFYPKKEVGWNRF